MYQVIYKFIPSLFHTPMDLGIHVMLNTCCVSHCFRYCSSDFIWGLSLTQLSRNCGKFWLFHLILYLTEIVVASNTDVMKTNMLQPWYEYLTGSVIHANCYLLGHYLSIYSFSLYCWCTGHYFISLCQKFKILDIWIFRFQFYQLFSWYSHFLSSIIFTVHTAYQDLTCCMYVCTNFIRYVRVCVYLNFSFKSFFRHEFCNISVPKVQFLAIEIARNREGYNDGLRETYCKKKQPAS